MVVTSAITAAAAAIVSIVIVRIPRLYKDRVFRVVLVACAFVRLNIIYMYVAPLGKKR